MSHSDQNEVVNLYEPTANAYSSMMDSEIQSRVYSETLFRLHVNLERISGSILDVSCGSGHMLSLYAEKFKDDRELIGIDLTPQMVNLAKKRLGALGKVRIGDMRYMPEFPDGAAAGLLNFFAIHHLDQDDLRASMREWQRLLTPGGQLVIAAWEGAGKIDYGGESEIVAFKYSQDKLNTLLQENGYIVDRCVIENIPEMSMDAVYIDATCT